MDFDTSNTISRQCLLWWFDLLHHTIPRSCHACVTCSPSRCNTTPKILPRLRLDDAIVMQHRTISSPNRDRITAMHRAVTPRRFEVKARSYFLGVMHNTVPGVMTASPLPVMILAFVGRAAATPAGVDVVAAAARAFLTRAERRSKEGQTPHDGVLRHIGRPCERGWQVMDKGKVRTEAITAVVASLGA